MTGNTSVALQQERVHHIVQALLVFYFDWLTPSGFVRIVQKHRNERLPLCLIVLTVNVRTDPR